MQFHQSPTQQTSPTSTCYQEDLPKVVFGEGVHESIEVDKAQLAHVMEKVGAPPDTAIYLGGKNNLRKRGFQWLKSHDRLVHGDQERNQGSGSVIRVNTKLRGKIRDQEDMNRTLVHELEHAAQMDRNDFNVKIGKLVIAGSTVLGLVAGELAGRKTDNKFARTLVPILGAIIGRDIGYIIAPHEREARLRAERTKTTAIKKQISKTL
jgi:hypothetical protein